MVDMVSWRGLLADFDTLLKRPDDAASRLAQGPLLGVPVRLLVGSLLCYALYGAVAGLFQGGVQVLLAALKAPLIVGFSVLLCAPSLYVFASLGGAAVPGRRLLSLLAGFGGTLALLFAGLLPIAWLFSVSSRSLPFVVWLHLGVWIVCLAFARKFLGAVFRDEPVSGSLSLWVVLLCVVAFQVTTMARPVLWRAADQPVIERERIFFLQHFGRVLDAAEPRKAAEKP